MTAIKLYLYNRGDLYKSICYKYKVNTIVNPTAETSPNGIRGQHNSLHDVNVARDVLRQMFTANTIACVHVITIVNLCTAKYLSLQVEPMDALLKRGCSTKLTVY